MDDVKSGYTQIRVSRKTKEKLKELKVTERESYESVIRRLISFYEKRGGLISLERLKKEVKGYENNRELQSKN